ncbi:DUF3140 domain-containing protein [Pseudonocardia endophytica]|uniref:DUF3140 domain-containing protein n=1 Tax=Pseudonocardia endophytica TaxID=401976 RepID=UPI00104E3A30|nr:DUF3140 domain-containing protein [Pseudonocardia endophytica]
MSSSRPSSCRRTTRVRCSHPSVARRCRAEASAADGHVTGERIVALQRTSADDLTDEDLDAMGEVVGFVHRRRAHPPPTGDVRSLAWRNELLNRGHDPLR